MGYLKKKVFESGVCARMLIPWRKELYSSELPIKGDYLLTGVEGLLHLNSTGVRRLLPLHCFGIAMDEKELFISHTVPLLPRRLLTGTVMLGFDREQVLAGCACATPRFLWGRVESSFNGRVHQIALDGNSLWLTNTDENTLVRISKEDGTVQSTIAPFSDEFGVSIHGSRVHHLNSVSCVAGLVCFTAFNPFGGQSLVGVFDEKRMVCFGYENEGVHDVHVAKGDMYISDSFGTGGPRNASGGFVLRNGKPYPALQPNFDKPYLVRGFARSGEEFVAGLSGLISDGKIGVRHQRGGVAVWNGQGTPEYVGGLPFSQCHDLVRLDGRHFDDEPGVQGFDEAATLMEQSFGPALFEKRAREFVSDR